MHSHDAEFREGETAKRTAKAILFKPSGKYYIEDEWEIPTEAELKSKQRNLPEAQHTFDFLPSCMLFSKDFRRLSGGAVLIPDQEPWGYPHLFSAIQEPRETVDSLRKIKTEVDSLWDDLTS